MCCCLVAGAGCCCFSVGGLVYIALLSGLLWFVWMGALWRKEVCGIRLFVDLVCYFIYCVGVVFVLLCD